ERHAREEAKRLHRPNGALLAFGAGERHCPGEGFARRIEGPLALAILIRALDVRPVSNKAPQGDTAIATRPVRNPNYGGASMPLYVYPRGPSSDAGDESGGGGPSPTDSGMLRRPRPGFATVAGGAIDSAGPVELPSDLPTLIQHLQAGVTVSLVPIGQ